MKACFFKFCFFLFVITAFALDCKLHTTLSPPDSWRTV